MKLERDSDFHNLKYTCSELRLVLSKMYFLLPVSNVYKCIYSKLSQARLRTFSNICYAPPSISSKVVSFDLYMYVMIDLVASS